MSQRILSSRHNEAEQRIEGHLADISTALHVLTYELGALNTMLRVYICEQLDRDPLAGSIYEAYGSEDDER